MFDSDLRRIIAAGVDAEVETLDKGRIFYIAASDANAAVAKLTSTQSASIDTELHIKHGSTLPQRKLK